MTSPVCPLTSVGEIYQGTEYSSECEDRGALLLWGEPLLARERESAAIFMLLEEQAADALPQEDQKARFLSRLPAIGKPLARTLHPKTQTPELGSESRSGSQSPRAQISYPKPQTPYVKPGTLDPEHQTQKP
jgi:hypothetical protein